MPRIYTKTGDDGTTGLLYGGRVPKDDAATEAYGTTDEAVAVLGLARASADPVMAEELLSLQRELFIVGADLATNPAERAKLQPGVSLVTSEMTERLERPDRRARGGARAAAGLHRPRCQRGQRGARPGAERDPDGRSDRSWPSSTRAAT